ncbi:hypothetical protein [uncultured Clostridium sp.]|uniref:hypothetical protein n=1 Tax=uncultured Clostridium sp. TaxID=59620 RepID=UPI0025F66C94|nr:hypothetical protein [uncultured Clostridium sp.]
MRIQTLNRDYEILQMAESGERMDVLIARDERHPEDGKCMLIVLKQKGDIYRFLPFLADQEENEPFDDFMGYFPRDGYLYMVFRFYEYAHLSDRLSVDTGLVERILLAGNVLRRIVFLHLPLYFQYEVLEKNNLLAGENGEVRFSYHFHDLDRFLDVTREEVTERLENILKDIFGEELETHSCPPIAEFLEQMCSKPFPGEAAILKQYEAAAHAALKLQEKGELKPKGLGFRIWERVKKIASCLKYVLLIAVMGALVGYLIYTIRYPSHKEEEVVNYRSIGTLTIGETDGADNGAQTGE